MRTKWFLLALSLLAVPVLAGCPGSSSVSTPKKYLDGGADYPQWPDLGQYKDGTGWPDQGTAKDIAQPSDVYPWQPDTYNPGSPFGCQQDSDCFGQRCCATPWGVKLCADTCELTPPKQP